MKKKHLILKLIISLILIALLLYKIKLENVYSTLLKINLAYIPLIILITLLTILIGSINIYILLKGLNKSIQFKQIFNNYNLSWALTWFAPSKTGELSLLYFLKKEGIDVGSSSAVFFSDKVITLITIIIMALVASLFLSPIDSLYVLIFSLIIILMIFLLLSSKKLLTKISPKIFHKFIDKFYQSLHILRYRKDLIAYNTILSVLRSLLSFFSIWVIYIAFDINANFIYIILFNIIITIASLVPFTLSGLGVREVSAVYLFSLIGIDKTITINVYLINLVKKYLFALFIIIFSKLKI